MNYSPLLVVILCSVLSACIKESASNSTKTIFSDAREPTYIKLQECDEDPAYLAMMEKGLVFENFERISSKKIVTFSHWEQVISTQINVKEGASSYEENLFVEKQLLWPKGEECYIVISTIKIIFFLDADGNLQTGRAWSSNGGTASIRNKGLALKFNSNVIESFIAYAAKKLK